MRKAALVGMFLSFGYASFATHIVGGEIIYTYLGNNNYEITLKVYRDCGATNTQGTGFDSNASIGIFESNSGDLIDANFSISLASAEVDYVPIELENPCFILPPDVCVERAVYTATYNLPNIPGGYELVYQRCCRNPSIVNLDMPQDQGATFTTHIPGSDEIAGHNSSAQFTLFPPVALCLNAEFYFDHSATDADGDVLVYEFCSPMLGGTPDFPAPVPPNGPPFTGLDYATGFGPTNPITSNPAFAIDPNTGYITGTATELGQFVIGICVSEYRNGQLINTTNRDFQFNVTNCDPNIQAVIVPPTDQQLCAGVAIDFQNESINAATYAWDFGVPSINSDTSSLENPSYNYTVNGNYVVTLIANPGWPCADTTQETFFVTPVINPNIVVGDYECVNGQDVYDFSSTGNMTADAVYAWDFGSGSTPSTSSLPNPQNVILNNSISENIISLTIYDLSCDETDVDTIANPPNPISAIVPQNIFCNGYQYAFENDAQNATTYLWNFGENSLTDTSLNPNPIHTFQDSGTYEVLLVVTAPFTCPDSSTETFQIYGALNPSFDPQDPQCFGNNSFNFIAEGATSQNAVYSWNFGSDATPQTSSSANTQVSFSTPTTHNITLTISENGCTEDFSGIAQVVEPMVTDVNVDFSAGCPPLQVDVNGTSISDVQVYYIWEFGDGTSSFQGESTHTYETTGTYDITVTAYTLVGCKDTITETFPEAVVVYPNPIPGFIITPQTVDILDPEIMVTDSSFGSIYCTYQMSDGGSSTFCDFNYTWKDAGIQTITQQVINEYGCKAKVTGTVIINGHVFYAPNTFTPDNDGVNDVWMPSMLGVTSFELRVFNRWGDLIFFSSEKSNPWVGDVHDGDYFAGNNVYNYIITLQDSVGLPYEYSGHVTQVR